ncbi:hypothetical protein EC991_011499, partial [Linnemannia zychae]
ESKLVASKEGSAVGSVSEESSDVDSSEDEEGSVTVDSNSEMEALSRPEGPVKRPTFNRAKSSKVAHDEEDLVIDEKNEVDEEIVSKGRVGWEVYKYYMTSIGIASCIVFILVILINLSVLIGTQLWLDGWGADNSRGDASKHSTQYWIMSYFGWVVAGAITLAGAIGLSMVFMALRGSRFLHAAMLRPLVRAPMSFFDVTSSGKIVNRFSHDINSIDLELPLQFTNMLFITIMAISIFAFAIIASRWVLAIMAPLSVAYYWLGGFFLVSSRELKRLDSAARSP